MPQVEGPLRGSEVLQKRFPKGTESHPPSLCNGSKPEYLLSKYESHYHPRFCFSQITKELSAVSRASVAPGRGRMERKSLTLCSNWGESVLKLGSA